jgi:hypothetical protein
MPRAGEPSTPAGVHAQNVGRPARSCTSPSARRSGDSCPERRVVYRLQCDQPTILPIPSVEHSPKAEWAGPRRGGLMVRAPGLAPTLRCCAAQRPRAGLRQSAHDSAVRVCLRPLGFDPVVNVIGRTRPTPHPRSTLASRACSSRRTRPTLSPSKWGDTDVRCRVLCSTPVRAAALAGGDSVTNCTRFHFGGILDGSRARRELGYVPERGIDWPRNGAAVRTEGTRIASSGPSIDLLAHSMRDLRGR